ncbi:MAG: hypothetical protein A3A47_03680 [Candidatus Levybacteria bacterium RIFCSPLOWO2_01_FULL_37_20]|nr:MAG: hypothetical protein A3A47_03680 [Candidatus Levybacteria bacterium RIFCSPLOWO2_01_FULL_37_20]OGH50473.1 MAG: hypothetical protein A3G13_00935 [Candidatus Levybacteria bacterium RIFCSPLOWO2_12_FULL_37_7]
MQKIFFSFLWVIVFLTLFSIQSDAYAKSSDATTSAIVKYDLAYPGMLPGSILYKLKVLRDKISASLISDPQKKIEFYLLQTDKGILATAMLIDKKKFELAKETALKSENNFTLLTYQLGNLPGKINNSLFTKLKKASLKHQEVLKSLLSRVPQKDRKTFQTVIDFSKRNLKTVEDFQKSQDLPQK